MTAIKSFGTKTRKVFGLMITAQGEYSVNKLADQMKGSTRPAVSGIVSSLAPKMIKAGLIKRTRVGPRGEMFFESLVLPDIASHTYIDETYLKTLRRSNGPGLRKQIRMEKNKKEKVGNPFQAPMPMLPYDVPVDKMKVADNKFTRIAYDVVIQTIVWKA